MTVCNRPVWTPWERSQMPEPPAYLRSVSEPRAYRRSVFRPLAQRRSGCGLWHAAGGSSCDVPSVGIRSHDIPAVGMWALGVERRTPDTGCGCRALHRMPDADAGVGHRAPDAGHGTRDTGHGTRMLSTGHRMRVRMPDTGRRCRMRMPSADTRRQTTRLLGHRTPGAGVPGAGVPDTGYRIPDTGRWRRIPSGGRRTVARRGGL
jgi:hypothetical protein